MSGSCRAAGARRHQTGHWRPTVGGRSPAAPVYSRHDPAAVGRDVPRDCATRPHLRRNVLRRGADHRHLPPRLPRSDSCSSGTRSSLATTRRCPLKRATAASRRAVRRQTEPDSRRRLGSRTRRRSPQSRLERRLTSNDLRAAGIDPVRASRYFRRRYGLTFQAFHRARRMGAGHLDLHATSVSPCSVSRAPQRQ